MSRIGKLPITLPKGVTATLKEGAVEIKGPKGVMEVPYKRVTIAMEGNTIVIQRPSDNQQDRAYHGLYRALLANAVKGVSEGFSKNLEIVGVGWRAEMAGNKLVLNLGYSHPIEIEPPAGITFKVADRSKITVEGFDKQAVGQVAAEVREWRRPEPYKGKGIRYVGEIVRQKAGKAGAK